MRGRRTRCLKSVTVPGPNKSTVTQAFGNTNNLLIAQQIANAIAAASAAGGLNVTVPGPGNTVPDPPPNSVTGGINELTITSGGVYSIPAGSAGSPDYLVVLDNTAPVTIFGSPNTSIWGGGSQVTVVDRVTTLPSAGGVDNAVITLSEGAGNAMVTLTGAGHKLAGNNQNDTITAAGNAESISAGTGNNLLFVSGSNDTVSAQGIATFQLGDSAFKDLAFAGKGATSISDAGTGDTLFGGSGQTSVTTSGSDASVVGGSAELDVTDSGSGTSIAAGTAAAFVTLGGSDALVSGSVGRFAAGLSVLDSGSGDTIRAGQGFTAVTATGGSFVRGGAGPLNFVGGTGPSTLVGGSGNATVFGGTGLTSVVGSAGGAFTYVNTTTGGLFYGAHNGNETIDASLSKATNTIYGGLDPNGHNLLVGGAGNDFINAGEGADTLVGGGGHNDFFFWSNYGGPNANHVIGDFSALDTVLLVNYGGGAAGAAIANATTAGGSTTITLSDNTRITFTGVTNSAALTGHIVSS